MNLILRKTEQVPFFTDMRNVFETTGITPQDYDWYISDIETNIKPPGFSWADRWMPGEELETLIEEHDIQFIWAVFSAVPKGLRPIIPAPPCADGNPHYWNGTDLLPQLKGALFEIACWDSSATILINLPAHAQRLFMDKYSDTRPLSKAT